MSGRQRQGAGTRLHGSNEIHKRWLIVGLDGHLGTAKSGQEVADGCNGVLVLAALLDHLCCHDKPGVMTYANQHHTGCSPVGYVLSLVAVVAVVKADYANCLGLLGDLDVLVFTSS